MMSAPKTFNIRKIAVLGAGPSGLAAAKCLLAEHVFSKIDIFEQRETVGGVWNFTPDVASSPALKLPQLDPNLPVVPQRQRDGGIVFPSPMYQDLETNIPKRLMQFPDDEFADHLQLFPRHEAVKEYVDEYAKDVLNLVQFSTQVLDVRLRESIGSASTQHESWQIKTRNLKTGLDSAGDYDAVVVAGGHYNVPFVPDIEGIVEWNEAHPGSMIHSKYYRKPDPFKDKTVLIVGNSSSGLDIGGHVSSVCTPPLLLSQRSKAAPFTPPGATEPWKHDLPEISAFLPPSSSHHRAIRFKDGHIETDIDFIIFCTGYLHSHPYLSSLNPNPQTEHGLRAQLVFQQIFFIPHPTLAFVGLPQFVITFPLAHNQAVTIARVWSNRLALPGEIEMCAWDAGELSKRGSGKEYHFLKFPLDAEYFDVLADWCDRAVPKSDGEDRMRPLRWGDKERWIRGRLQAIKRAFNERGEGRYAVRTLEELGFDYEEWKKEGEDCSDEFSANIGG